MKIVSTLDLLMLRLSNAYLDINGWGWTWRPEDPVQSDELRNRLLRLLKPSPFDLLGITSSWDRDLPKKSAGVVVGASTVLCIRVAIFPPLFSWIAFNRLMVSVKLDWSIIGLITLSMPPPCHIKTSTNENCCNNYINTAIIAACEILNYATVRLRSISLSFDQISQ